MTGLIITVLIIVVLLMALLSGMDERLLYIENYLRQILDTLHEMNKKQ